MAYQQPNLGDLIAVYWPDDDAFYVGCVTEFSASTSRHRVEYKDGEVEDLDLRKERWHLSSPSSAAVIKSVRRNDAPQSPVSILVNSSCRCPLAMIGYVANRWLRDESRRPGSAVKPAMIITWVSICTDLCMQYICDWFSTTSVDIQDIELEDTRWLVENRSLKYSQRNYNHWKHPLSQYEMYIEGLILQGIAKRYAAAVDASKLDPANDILHRAKLIAETAVQAEAPKLELIESVNPTRL